MKTISEIIARVLWKAGLHSRLCFNATIRFNGTRTIVPVLGGLGYENLCSHEPWMEALLAKLLPMCPGAFLDVGANLGQTLIKAKSLAPDRVVVAVEPNPICLFYLEMLVRANRYRDCWIIPSGLSKEHSLAKLFFFDDSIADASASMIDGFRAENISGSRIIGTCTYPELSHALGRDDFGLIKIDVEGAEWEVLQSLAGLLASRRPILLLEILPVYSADNKARLERQLAVEKILGDCGYKLLRVAKGSSGILLGLTPVNDIGVHGDIALTDYVVVPNEAEDKVRSVFAAHGPN
jgi:FkbM family methyltransferase